ncbi:serine hydrolase domain-containing protein [Fredinandcohnia humi]
MKRVNEYVLKLFIIFAFLFASFPVSVFAEVTTKSAFLNKEEVESFVNNYYGSNFKNKKAFGEMSITVVHQNNLLYQNGFQEPSSKVAGDLVHKNFYLGSIAKTITAIAVMQLVEKGKLDLESDINSYLKDIKIKNPFQKKVTLIDLLTYSAGFDEPNPPEYVTEKEQQLLLKEYLIKYQPPIVREPGTSVMYDNYAYNLAGYIVEQVSGIPFNDYVRQNILLPLGMEQSSFRVNKSIFQDMVKGYSAPGEEQPFFYTVAKDLPDGGLVSTGSDMSHFMQMLINKGMFREERIISEASYNAIVKERFPMTGFGLDILYYKNHKVIRKGGDLGNYHSVYWVLPDHHIGIFIAVSGFAGDFSDFIKKFVDHFIDGTFLDKNATPDIQQSREELNELAGTYQYIRQSESTYRKIINFFRDYSQMKVEMVDKGKLKIHFMGQEREFVQLNEQVFKEVGNEETLGNNNQLTIFKNYDRIYLQMPEEASFFKKVNWYDQLSLHLALFIGLTVLFLIFTGYLFLAKTKIGKTKIRIIASWNCLFYFMFLPILLFTAMQIMGGASQHLMYIPLAIPILGSLSTALLITMLIKDWSSYKYIYKVVYIILCAMSLLYIALLNYWNLFF